MVYAVKLSRKLPSYTVQF